MSGRISYYIHKAKLSFSNRGVRAVSKEALFFLIRRRFFLQFLFEAIEYHFISQFRNLPATILKVMKEDPLSSNRVLCYAHYDAKSKVDDYVIPQLQAFCDDGYQIIFVTTSPDFPVAEYEKIKSLVTVCVHRKNEGYDFASYRVAFDLIGPRYSSLESLIVMNDSCLGPLFPMNDILKKMRDSVDSVYGISISEEIAEHIQSYFYHFGSSVLRKPVTKSFFDRIRILRNKWAIVRYFEMGSSKLLLTEGIGLKALVNPKDSFVKENMRLAQLTEPTRDPVAAKCVELKMTPFYKRSNQKL
jgi:lipopolysaccharide biosynthesis protein